MQPKIPTSDLYRELPSKEAAEFLHVSESTLARKRREGTGPKYIRKNASVVRYRLIDLIEEQEKFLVGGEVSNG